MPSIEELLLMLHSGDFERLSARGSLLDQVTPALLHGLSDELLDMGVPLVVIKLGGRGPVPAYSRPQKDRKDRACRAG